MNTDDSRQTMIKYRFYSIIIIISILSSCSDSKQETPQPIINPKNPIQPYTYDFHGVSISDNYHWLSDGENQQVAEWIQEQSNLTQSYFEQSAFSEFRNTLNNQESVNNYMWGQKLGYYIFSIVQTYNQSQVSWSISQYNTLSNKNNNYPVNLYQNESIVGFRISNHARYMGCLIKTSNNKYQWRIFDTANSSFLDKPLPLLGNKTNLQWVNSSQFIYSDQNKILLSSLLSSATQDTTIFEQVSDKSTEEANSSSEALSAQLSTDFNYSIISQNNGFKDGTKVWVKANKNDEQSTLLIDKINARFQYLGNTKEKFYFLTNLSASKNRIISLDLNRPSRRHWKEVIPQNKNLLADAVLVKNQWLLLYKENTQNKVIRASINGENNELIEVMDFATLEPIKQNRLSDLGQNTNNISLNRSNILSSTQTIIVEDSNNLSQSSFNELLKTEQKALGIVQPDFNSQVHFFRSQDGSRVPVTLISKSPVTRNSPIILLANDADGTIFHSNFDPVLHQFVIAGGSLAIVHNRGGAIYGDNWFYAGIGTKRGKVIEDLIAAQNWLFDKNYTSPEKLAIYANKKNSANFAQYILHPESDIKSAIFSDGNFDLIAKASNLKDGTEDMNWSRIYSFDASSKSVDHLLQLDPLSNIKTKAYPSVLISSVSSETDDLKFIAKLQNHQLVEQPILWLDANDPNKNEKVGFFLKQQLLN